MRIKTTLFIASVAALIALAPVSSLGQQLKFGVVDLGKLAEDSIVGKREKVAFDALRDNVNDLLTFMSTHRVMTREQRTRLRDLWLKDGPTAAETTELGTLKTAIQTASQRYCELVRKTNPTADEVTEISEKSALANATQDVFPGLQQELLGIMQTRAGQKQQEVLDKARAAVQKLGRRDGYTVIFESSVAIFAANDVTADALKIMDADNP